MYELTVFSSIFDNKTDVKVEFDTFTQFEKSLYHLATLPGYKPKRGESSKNASPLISPATYKPDSTRSNANVVNWGAWAALDVDDHEFKGDLKDELHARFGIWYYICYNSASSTAARPKFRLVFPLTRAVRSDEIKHFWYALNTEFGCMGDLQTKDLSRMYYVPAQYPGAFNFIFSNVGIHIDPSRLMEKHPWTAPVSSDNFFDRLPETLQKEVLAHRKAKLQENTSNLSWTSYKDCPFVNQSLVSDYTAISRTDGSGRYSMFYKIMTSIACNAVKRHYPITEYEIVDIVRGLDRATSNRYAKRPLNVEASRAIEFAYKNI